MGDYKNNIFEKIGAFIPGYSGYAEKEGRRDTDKLLRIEIAKYLDGQKENVDQVIRQQMNDKKMEFIGELDRIKRNMDTVANQVRYANYGESGFFDIVQVDADDLDRLYRYDLEIKEETEQLSCLIISLQSADDLKDSCGAALRGLSALSKKIVNRDKVITEVQ